MTGRGPLFIGHDLGTGGDKAVLVDASARILASAFEPYPLDHPRPGWAEQDPSDYWRAVCTTTRSVLTEAGVDARDVAGVGFAAQMLTMVPLDDDRQPVRPAISWLDARAEEEARRMVRRLGGPFVVRTVVGVLPSAKDVVCKMAWIRRHEPQVHDRIAAFCDATGYLVARATGQVLADDTAAGATGLFDRRRHRWQPALVALSGIPRRKLPVVRPSSEVVGGLRPEAADDLGLVTGTPVVAGTGDVPAAQVGSGAVRVGEAHVCLGTSGWLCVTTDEPADKPRVGVFSLPAADRSVYATVGEMETAGECLDWLAGVTGADVGTLIAEAEQVPAGSDGLLFAPWLFGERAPINDTDLRGGFVNLSLDHGRGHLARAVLEGVAHNLRWLLEVMVGETGLPRLRVIGGGVRSDLWMQIVADVTGRVVEPVIDPQHAGARGAALLAAIGTGSLAGFASVPDLIPLGATRRPDTAAVGVYEAAHRAFRSAHPAMRDLGRLLRSG